MSGMGSVGASGGQCSSVNANSAAMRQRMDPSKRAEGMQERLDQKLESAGVSEETRSAIQADLKTAFEDQISSGSRPDPETMKETVSGVFEKHGLNAEDFMPEGGPPGRGGMRGPRGRGSMGNAQGANGSQMESLQTFLESLQEDDGQTDAASASDEFSSQVLDYLFGIDEEA